MKKDTISISVKRDEKNIPERIEWKSEVLGVNKSANAMFLSFWDEDEKQTLSLNLWTKGMLVDDMRLFCLQTLNTLGKMLQESTQDNEKLINEINTICNTHLKDEQKK